MEHPVIENVMNTGFADGHIPTVQECECCGDEVYMDEGYEFEGDVYCSPECVGRHLYSVGAVQKTA